MYATRVLLGSWSSSQTPLCQGSRARVRLSSLFFSVLSQFDGLVQQELATPPVSATGTLVVARYLNGRTVKGTTQDFAPAKTQFHVFPHGDRSAHALEVDFKDLKAVFFVKSYDGDADHHEDYSFDRVKGHGRKAVVTFNDGETIVGYTMGYHPDRPGFFLLPAEERSNNARVFIVNAAVKDVQQV